MTEASPHLPTRDEAEAMRVRLSSTEIGSPGLDAEIRALLGLSSGNATPLTTSFDAALDLIEVVLPGWSVDMQGNRVPHARDLEEYPGKGPYFFVSTSAPLNPGSFSAGFVPATTPQVGATRALSAMAALFASLASERVGILSQRHEETPDPSVTARTVSSKLFDLPRHEQWLVILETGLDRDGDENLNDTDFVLTAVERAKDEDRLQELDRETDKVKGARGRLP